MYLFVVVLSTAGRCPAAGARDAVRRAVLALAACALALLLTHYWSLFLLAAVGLVHLPGLLRRSAPDVRVVVALVLAGVGFLPWLPTFLFQAPHRSAVGGRGWARSTCCGPPQVWGGGATPGRAGPGGAASSGLAGWAAWLRHARVRPCSASRC
jgi:hypothetical protein